ncbi:hypothetical protein QZH56_35910 [Streptomyces olivoreticuli]|uniref:hypothetical protein n=1 Tax=Streptomyces olivoreticuli TaxID=68246 RepID=UPI0026597337|nr:hypothetical protein [Streptomyces olivoreticuli]WKK24002.1 hypothetical protein QZH56_35910 [Streptomyces olivoreticuli]
MEAELARVLLDNAPRDRPGARALTDRFGHVHFDAVIAALQAAQMPPADRTELLPPSFLDEEARRKDPLGQLVMAVDRATDGLVSELLSVPWPQTPEATSGPVTVRCERLGGDTDEDFKITMTYQHPADSAHRRSKDTADADLGAVDLATFEAVEDMSQMPAWFGFGTPTLAALPDLPEDTPVVVLPVQSQYDDLFKEVLTSELRGDRNIAEIVYASVIWATSCAWSGFEGICEAHLQACCALGALGIAIDYVLEAQSPIATEAVQALARTAVPSYLGPDAQYMRMSVALTAANFVRRIMLQSMPPGQGRTTARITPTQYIRCRWVDGAIYAWLATMEQARASEEGALYSGVKRAIGQCSSAIAAYDLISRYDDLTDVWTDACTNEPYNELLQAVRHGYRGSFVPYARAVTAIVEASCDCTCPHGFHADAADVGIALCAMMPLLPRYNALAQYATYRCSLPEPGGSIDVFVCRPVPQHLDRMIFTPDWQLMPWVIEATGDWDDPTPPADSAQRAPRQWANRIADFRRDQEARDAVQTLLAQGPQAPSAYCAKDRVLRVLAAAAPHAEPTVLRDAAALIADVWDLAVELHRGHTQPASAARSASHMYVRLDRLTYTAGQRHHNSTAVAVQRACRPSFNSPGL